MKGGKVRFPVELGSGERKGERREREREREIERRGGRRYILTRNCPFTYLDTHSKTDTSH